MYYIHDMIFAQISKLCTYIGRAYFIWYYIFNRNSRLIQQLFVIYNLGCELDCMQHRKSDNRQTIFVKQIHFRRYFLDLHSKWEKRKVTTLLLPIIIPPQEILINANNSTVLLHRNVIISEFLHRLRFLL